MLMRGFTLIETLAVIGMLGIIATLTTLAGLDSFRRSQVASDYAALHTALLEARSESLAGVCQGSSCVGGAAHGISIQPAAFVLFQGGSYATRDETADEFFGREGAERIEGEEVIFSAGSAEVEDPRSITLTDLNGRRFSLQVNKIGRVSPLP